LAREAESAVGEVENLINASVVPQITAVSNPKIGPSSEATIALRTASEFMRNTVNAKVSMSRNCAIS
jgi:hypothetical protein